MGEAHYNFNLIIKIKFDLLAELTIYMQIDLFVGCFDYASVLSVQREVGLEV